MTSTRTNVFISVVGYGFGFSEFWVNSDTLKSLMNIVIRFIGLASLLFKLLAIHIGELPPGEPIRLQNLIGRLRQDNFLQVLPLMVRSPDLLIFQIIFQVIWIGIGIYSFISGSIIGCKPVVTIMLYSSSLGFLVYDGIQLYRTWKRLPLQPQKESVV